MLLKLLLILATVVSVSNCSMPATASQADASRSVSTAGRQFAIDGEPFVVRGIHYGPWRPGTGPNKQYSFPSREHVAEDFRLIRAAHANTVLIYDAPPDVLDLAEQHGLKVVYVFALDWWAIAGPTQPTITQGIIDRVAALRMKPALLAWMLGNEVGGDVLQQRGPQPIVTGLRDLYGGVKAADAAHPISHANWPPARHLDLSFLDFVSFNLYPLWPPEVVATGYGRYIEKTLRPLAGDKALLISEFGVNTIEGGEDGQARLLRSSWTELLAAGAAGGVVFEFADEWWKNYNNPVRPGDWWSRESAIDDEHRHDEDPEEHYGIVRADRSPKPAYQVVADMYADQPSYATVQLAGAAIIGTLVLFAVGTWAWARRVNSRPAPR